METSYYVDHLNDGRKTYYVIREKEDMSLVISPTRYLLHKQRSNRSPNTIRRIAFSLSYYLMYLDSLELDVETVFDMKYEIQFKHFTDFLLWLKKGSHCIGNQEMLPKNKTCNIYLKDVFGWYQFLEHDYVQLKVLSTIMITHSDAVGVRISSARRTFKGYLTEEESIGRTIEEDEIIVLLNNCTNLRDKLLLLLLAETGYRIGEILGIKYSKDIDYRRKTVKVFFRDDNQNDSRAKNAEYRSARISDETFEILMCYLSQYRDILKDSEYLFVVLSGKNLGQPLTVNAVYAFLRRMKEKTGISAAPHMLRHYFANVRYRNGWDILLLSQALGHKNISTTRKYLNTTADELLKAADEFYQKKGSLYNVDLLIQ